MGSMQGLVSTERDGYGSHLAPPRCALSDALCGAKTEPPISNSIDEVVLRISLEFL